MRTQPSNNISDLIVIIESSNNNPDTINYSSKDLIDYLLSDDEVARITWIICEHQEEYVNFHELRTRRAGHEIFIDLHLVVDKDISVEHLMTSRRTWRMI